MYSSESTTSRPLVVALPTAAAAAAADADAVFFVRDLPCFLAKSATHQ